MTFSLIKSKKEAKLAADLSNDIKEEDNSAEISLEPNTASDANSLESEVNK